MHLLTLRLHTRTPYMCIYTHRLLGLTDAIVLGDLCSCSGEGGRRNEVSSQAISSVAMPMPRTSSELHHHHDVHDARHDRQPPPLPPRTSSTHTRTPGSILSFRRWASASSTSLPVPPRWTHGQSSELAARQAPSVPSTIRIFATTWNMGGGVTPNKLEAELPGAIHMWIPHGYDLYVSIFIPV